MFKEYDVVKATGDLTEKVSTGTIGTVLLIYDGLPRTFEVEFVDTNNQTLQVITVSEDKITEV